MKIRDKVKRMTIKQIRSRIKHLEKHLDFLSEVEIIVLNSELNLRGAHVIWFWKTRGNDHKTSQHNNCNHCCALLLSDWLILKNKSK